MELVKVILPYSNPNYEESLCFRIAASNGHSSVVEFLIPFSDPMDQESEALRWSANNGHLEVVKYLLPYSNPKDDNSAPLLLAATEGYLEVVKYLLPFSDVDLVYDKLTKNKDEVVSYKIKSSIEVINDYLFRKKLNDILSEEIDNSSERKKRKF